MRLIAIVGGSGSGKSALGLELASKLDCEIFSLDSLSIYQEIDIASAKPSLKELENVYHYGINVLRPNQENNAILFKNLLIEAIKQTQAKGKSCLLIIGGSSFYLKSITEGLSAMPTLTQEERIYISQKIASLHNPSRFLFELDPLYPCNPNDTYRIQKALEIYFATQTLPSEYFKTHTKEAFKYPIEKYALFVEREKLREKIKLRTQQMLKQGILEEVKNLIQNYGTHIQPCNAIGIKECIEFLHQAPLKNSKTQIAKTQQELCELISTHTAQLAKRQSTFNRTQFGKCLPPTKESKGSEGIIWGDYQELFKLIP